MGSAIANNVQGASVRDSARRIVCCATLNARTRVRAPFPVFLVTTHKSSLRAKGVPHCRQIRDTIDSHITLSMPALPGARGGDWRVERSDETDRCTILL